jgi:TRAP-type mannitol/chloroaromatic compound transport system substrate-binding protein
MSTVAIVLAVIALSGALVSWVAGAIFYARTLATLSEEKAPAKLRWLAVFGWPFALQRLQGAAAEQAAKVNKSIVAFMTCVIVAAAAIAVATNLQRIGK